uniref:tRNA (guanine(26)-N(2))-dimethyltransferase n=1 Tax=Archaeoglobus fulgidus TaxID=2234 RepID=A0A7J2THA0_ARCFL
MLVIEGKAKIIVEGAFYNPRMQFCRDLDMLVFSAIGKHQILDALSATGVRGIRAMLEAGCQAVFNDANPRAVENIRKNLEINNLDAEVFCLDASILTRIRKFEHVDIDPFGSPANFIESACVHSKYLSVTATDLEALCCKTSAGLKKYSAFVLKTDVPHEIGLRVLIGFIARVALKFEKAIYPLVSWAKEHYYRVHLRIKRSNSEATKTLEKIGQIAFCRRCLKKDVIKLGETAEICKCGEKPVIIGPLWLAELKDAEFVKKVVSLADGKHRDFLIKIQNEVDYPTAYSIPKICSTISKPVPPISQVVEKLKKAGYAASVAHYCGYCVKTDAGIEKILEILRS